jgi:hypothetical protein
MYFIYFINLIFCWLCWQWAKADFEEGNNGKGWVNVFFSALNFAVVLNAII